MKGQGFEIRDLESRMNTLTQRIRDYEINVGLLEKKLIEFTTIFEGLDSIVQLKQELDKKVSDSLNNFQKDFAKNLNQIIEKMFEKRFARDNEVIKKLFKITENNLKRMDIFEEGLDSQIRNRFIILGHEQHAMAIILRNFSRILIERKIMPYEEYRRILKVAEESSKKRDIEYLRICDKEKKGQLTNEEIKKMNKKQQKFEKNI